MFFIDIDKEVDNNFLTTLFRIISVFTLIETWLSLYDILYPPQFLGATTAHYNQSNSLMGAPFSNSFDFTKIWP